MCWGLNVSEGVTLAHLRQSPEKKTQNKTNDEWYHVLAQYPYYRENEYNKIWYIILDSHLYQVNVGRVEVFFFFFSISTVLCTFTSKVIWFFVVSSGEG